MKIKRDLELHIRGWFPQDPLIHRQATLSTKPTKRPLAFSLNEVATVVIVLGALIPFVLLSNSWIKNWLVTLTFLLGLAYLIIRRHNYTGRRPLKKALVALMAFALCFTAVEVCLFLNAGYPATYSSANPDKTLTKETILNASVTEILKETQQSAAFSLLKLEHNTPIMFESMSLSTLQKDGRVNVDFCSQDGKNGFTFSSIEGNQYYLSVSSNSRTGSYSERISLEEAVQALEQIDALGLDWFYNQTMQKTGLQFIETSNVNLIIRSSSNYDGLILQMAGNHPQIENGYGLASVISSFQPNGELISITELR